MTLSNNIGLGYSRVVTLTYQTHLEVSAPSLTHGGHRFLLNSIFDPDYEVGGHQPFGHDTYQTLYQQYRVLGTTISGTFMHNISGSTPVRCGIFLDKNGTLDSMLSTKLEQSKGRGQKLLLANSREVVRVKQHYDEKTYFNLSDYTDDHQTKAPFGASPTLPAFGVVWAQAVGPYDSASPLQVDVLLTMRVLLTDPIPLTQS